jgi:hypothetical protein
MHVHLRELWDFLRLANGRHEPKDEFRLLPSLVRSGGSLRQEMYLELSRIGVLTPWECCYALVALLPKVDSRLVLPWNTLSQHALMPQYPTLNLLCGDSFVTSQNV